VVGETFGEETAWGLLMEKYYMLMEKGEFLAWIRTACYSLHWWALLNTVTIL
jgi:hypothetical protein